MEVMDDPCLDGHESLHHVDDKNGNEIMLRGTESDCLYIVLHCYDCGRFAFEQYTYQETRDHCQ